MTPAGANNVFVDTNVLVYAAMSASPLHDAALEALRQRYAAGDKLWISTQVMREFAAVVTSPRFLPVPLTDEELQMAIRFFYRRFQVAEDTQEVSREWLRLLALHPVAGRRVHDVNIVAACVVHGIPALLTHNVRDFTDFASPTFHVIPLVTAGANAPAA